MQPVADRVLERKFRSGLTSLSEDDRVFFLVWCYAGMVDNGGLASFFYNSCADYYQETLHALRALNLPQHAELLERAARLLFSTGAVPATMEERNNSIDTLPDDEESEDEFDGLEDELTEQVGGERALQALQNWYFSADRA